MSSNKQSSSEERSPRSMDTSQSEQSEQTTTISGVFFAGSRNFEITGGSFNHAARDMHQTVNNDNSKQSDFNNDHRDAATYNGAAMHNDRKGSNTNVAMAATFATTTSSSQRQIPRNFQGQQMNVSRKKYTTLEAHPGYNIEQTLGNLNGNDREFAAAEYAENMRIQAQQKLYFERQKQDGFEVCVITERTLPRVNNKQMTMKGPGDRSTADVNMETADAEVEDSGKAELRQCVQTFLANAKQKDLPGLADALIDAGWDRETLMDAHWDDIKGSYPEWQPATFVKLRTICVKWVA
ncbi:uncharacterized protein C8R40DRAFT_1166949 [Lentinula edodes]|uniref:uncharacterized protein n=1 Tax=Lentinula edodes TaxID=5353 RepID=UPI001E8D834D|nr:uncharacterized protein C8R40DRAFT_1166949 [Lentinula edodes]KAH7878982.1 hypothetical protein C8R40DRAFT_1166949 [Lentinula edodes]